MRNKSNITKQFNDHVRVYAFSDRSWWPAGPWDDEEPDKIQWVDEATGLDCLMVRNSGGAWCGYVGVDESHPWFAIDYGSCPHEDQCDDEWGFHCAHCPDNNVTVHGGLTYSAFCDDDGPEESSICHLPFSGRPDRIWWFGFDTCHSRDTYPGWERSNQKVGSCGLHEVYRTIEYVREQCASLATQLKAAS